MSFSNISGGLRRDTFTSTLPKPSTSIFILLMSVVSSLTDSSGVEYDAEVLVVVEDDVMLLHDTIDVISKIRDIIKIGKIIILKDFQIFIEFNPIPKF